MGTEVPAVPPELTPLPDAPPHPVVRAIHSHAVGFGGAAIAILGVVIPLLSPQLLAALGVNPATRAGAAIGLVVAILAALNGKGVFSPREDDTVGP